MNIELNRNLPGRAFVQFTAYFYMILGLLFLVNPRGMSSGLGFEILNEAAATDVMATYGGLWISIGVVLLILYWNSEMRIALVIILLTFLGFAVGRSLGALRFGGFYGLNFYWLLSEIAYVGVTNYFLRKYRVTEEKKA